MGPACRKHGAGTRGARLRAAAEELASREHLTRSCVEGHGHGRGGSRGGQRGNSRSPWGLLHPDPHLALPLLLHQTRLETSSPRSPPGRCTPGRALAAGGACLSPTDFLSGVLVVQGTQCFLQAPAAENSLGLASLQQAWRPVLSELREATSSGKVACGSAEFLRKNRAHEGGHVCVTDDGLLVPRVLSSNLCCCEPLCCWLDCTQPQLPAPLQSDLFCLKIFYLFIYLHQVMARASHVAQGGELPGQCR